MKKIKRTTVLNNPVNYESGDIINNEDTFWSRSGLELPQFVENVITIMSIIQIVLQSIVTSISLVYEEIRASDFFYILSIVSVFFSIFELTLNLFTIKYRSGKKLKTFLEIWKNYSEGYLLLDILTAIFLTLYVLFPSDILSFFKIIIFLKLPQSLEKLEKM